MSKNHEIISKKNKKVSGKFKTETPKNTCIDEFVCLRSKMFAFNFGAGSKDKLKAISKSYSGTINFEQNKNCLDGEKYQSKSNDYIIPSLSHEMYLQKIVTNLLSIFGGKRCYEAKIEGKPWK